MELNLCKWNIDVIWALFSSISFDRFPYQSLAPGVRENMNPFLLLQKDKKRLLAI
jgi:hypothetical protein